MGRQEKGKAEDVSKVYLVGRQEKGKPNEKEEGKEQQQNKKRAD